MTASSAGAFAFPGAFSGKQRWSTSWTTAPLLGDALGSAIRVCVDAYGSSARGGSMNEDARMLAEKAEVDAFWDRYYKLNSFKRMEVRTMEKPSQRQLEYIAVLAEETGSQVDMATIPTGHDPSRLIEELKAKRNGANDVRNGNGADLRDRGIAFGIATKLVFKRYSDQQKDPKKGKRFWKDVEAFYRAYQQQQEKAVRAIG